MIVDFGCGSCFSQFPDIDIFRIVEQWTASIKAACSTTDGIGQDDGGEDDCDGIGEDDGDGGDAWS